MRFGNARFGETRFGTGAQSASGEPSSMSLSVEGRSSGLETSVESPPRQMDIGVDGSAVGLEATPTPQPWTLSIATEGGATSLATGSGIEYHIPAMGRGEVGDTTLTIEAGNPDLIGTVSPPRNIPERERIEGYLKRPFETDYPAAQSGGVHGAGEFSFLIDVFAAFAQELNGAKNDVLAAKMIDIAYGQSLDHIGRLLLLPRRTGESDPHYRLRLKASARAMTGEATIDQVRETIAILLDCDVIDVELEEPSSQPAQFDLTIDQTIIDESATTVDDLVELVKRFRAGGVKVTLTVTGSFMYRSIDDFESGTDLGEHGYEEAGYSGRII